MASVVDLVSFFLATASFVTGEPPKGDVSPMAIEASLKEFNLARSLGGGGEPSGASAKSKVGKTKLHELTDRGPKGTPPEKPEYSPRRGESSDSHVAPAELSVGNENGKAPGKTGRLIFQGTPEDGRGSRSDAGSVEHYGNYSHGHSGGSGGGYGGSKKNGESEEGEPLDFSQLTPEQLQAFERFRENTVQGHPPFADGEHPNYNPFDSARDNIQPSQQDLPRPQFVALNNVVEEGVVPPAPPPPSAGFSPPPPPPPPPSTPARGAEAVNQEHQRLFEQIRAGSPLKRVSDSKLAERREVDVPKAPNALEQGKNVPHEALVKTNEEAIKAAQEAIANFEEEVERYNNQMLKADTDMQQPGLSKLQRDRLERQLADANHRRAEVFKAKADHEKKLGQLEDQKRGLVEIQRRKEQVKRLREERLEREAANAAITGSSQASLPTRAAVSEEDLGDAKEILPLLTENARKAVLANSRYVKVLSSLSLAEREKVMEELQSEASDKMRMPILAKVIRKFDERADDAAPTLRRPVRSNRMDEELDNR